MYTSFKGKTVELYSDTKQIIRKFRVQADVVNAYITGSGKDACVAITMKNGKTVLYRSNGQLVRR